MVSNPDTGSKDSNKKVLAKTRTIIPYIETQSLHCIGTWTLREMVFGKRFLRPLEGSLNKYAWSNTGLS